MGSETKNGVATQLAPKTKKMIQSLKEIVNCPEPEIYSVLKDCNMDPNEAVQRLLALDTFHEVKSKRERRKEMKETQDSKPRVHNNGSNHGVKGISERNGGWCGSTQTSSNELGKEAYVGQNGFDAPSLYLSVSHFTGGTTSQQPSSHRDSSSTSIGSDDAISASVEHAPGNQSNYFGNSSGHFSMADIVKMGTHQYMDSQNPSSVSEMIQKPGDGAGKNGFHDEWPAIELPTAGSRSSVINSNAEVDSNQSYTNESNMPRDYQSHKVQASEGNFHGNNLSTDRNAYAFASSRQKVDASGGRSYCVDDLSSNSSSYDSHRSACENREGTGIGSNVSCRNQPASNDVAAVSSATMNMQQLNLGKEEPADDCAVVLPSNLQDLAADCSHLSFGTFRSGPSSAISRSPSNSSKNDMGGFSAGIDVLSAAQLDTRNPMYSHEEPLGSLYETGRATIDARNFDFPVPRQADLINRDILEAALGHKDIVNSSLPELNSENTERGNSGFPFARADPKFRSTPLLNDMAYSDSIRGDLLGSLSQFLVPPSVPSRYSSAVQSVNNPTISMSEAPRPGALPLSEGSSALPQHLTARSYSKPTLNYEQLASIIGYPSVPQSYSSMPSTLQQEYLGGSAYHQSMASMEYSLPQYRSGASMSRLPPPAAAGNGHGSFGASNNLHGNFLHNSSATPMGMSDYDDVLRTQYKDGNHLSHLHQNSRTLPSVSDSAYNNLLGQNQHHAEYLPGHAGQLPSHLQHYGSPRYPDFYRSQVGVPQERQRQSLNGSGLGGFQDLSPKQLHQIWQRTY